MSELNKAELLRLAEAAMPGDWFKAGDLLCFDAKTGETHGLNVEDDRFIASASPDAVLSLLGECDRLQATCEGLDRQNDAIAEEIGKVAAERDAALAGLEALRNDAERYRWLRQADWWSSPLCAVRNPKEQAKPGTDCPSRDRLDSAIDAAMSKERSQ